jgi:hypothetical protein
MVRKHTKNSSHCSTGLICVQHKMWISSNYHVTNSEQRSAVNESGLNVGLQRKQKGVHLICDSRTEMTCERTDKPVAQTSASVWLTNVNEEKTFAGPQISSKEGTRLSRLAVPLLSFHQRGGPPLSSTTCRRTNHETKTWTQLRPRLNITYKLRRFPWRSRHKRMTK